MDTPDIAPVTGLRGLEHVGLTVPDMEQALDFFARVLGAETLYEVGPLRAEDNWMAVNLGVAADAVIPRLVMIRVGVHGPALELFEYEHPDAERHPPPQSAVGGQHLAFYVEDIDAGVDSLRAHNVITLGEPKRVIEGAVERARLGALPRPLGSAARARLLPERHRRLRGSNAVGVDAGQRRRPGFRRGSVRRRRHRSSARSRRRARRRSGLSRRFGARALPRT